MGELRRATSPGTRGWTWDPGMCQLGRRNLLAGAPGPGGVHTSPRPCPPWGRGQDPAQVGETVEEGQWRAWLALLAAPMADGR